MGTIARDVRYEGQAHLLMCAIMPDDADVPGEPALEQMQRAVIIIADALARADLAASASIHRVRARHAAIAQVELFYRIEPREIVVFAVTEDDGTGTFRVNPLERLGLA